MGLRRKLSPMPVAGLNRFRIRVFCAPVDSAPLPWINQAAVSVNDAPAPSNC